MQALAGAVLVAAALLVLAGVPKILRPTATASALRAVGLPFVTRTHVRVLAVVEVAVGAVSLVVGGVLPALAVALLYAGFSVFLVRALLPREEGAAGISCGCTGRADTPPTWAHLVLTTTLAVLCAAAALGGGADGLAGQETAVETTLLAGYTALGTWFGWVVLTVLPELQLLRPAHEH